jgi:hypothetical protein
MKNALFLLLAELLILPTSLAIAQSPPEPQRPPDGETLVQRTANASQLLRRSRSVTRFHTSYICVPKELVRQVEFFSAPKFLPPTTGPASTTNESGFPSREGLGKQVIGGLETVGRRETTTLEAGTIGNDTQF